MRAKSASYPAGSAANLSAAFSLAGWAASRMEAQYERLRLTLSSIGDGVIATDAEGRVTFINPVAERLLGWPLAETEGKPLEEIFRLVHEETRAPAHNPVPRCMSENRVVRLPDHTILIARDGNEFGIEDSTAPILDAKGRVAGAVMVFRDVTEQRRLIGEISYRATHDPLTGLLNRSMFEKRLQTAVDSTRQTGAEHVLCYVDLDRFKQVNDICGHAAGDQLLQRVAGVLARCVRSRDTLARLGGDEFALLLEHCDLEQAQRVAQKICDRIDQMPVLYRSRNFRISVSIGLVPVGHGTTVAAVQQAADIACYAAKESGRNCVRVYVDDSREQGGLVDWKTRIEHAMRNDRLLLYGQRIHSLRENGDKPHCEVLLRLQDEKGGIFPPGAFLPEAERFNIASRVDQWTLRNVMEFLGDGRERLQHIERIAINLSGQSLGDPDFQRAAMSLLASSKVDLRKLCFEITETAAIASLDEAAAFVRELHGQGIGFSLDDFGSGFSSFNYLKSLPVDYLKIDGRFVQNILNDPIDHATVKCFAEVAKVAGKTVIAEWVECEATATALGKLGVDYIQGYWQHRPEPLSRVLGLTSR